MSDQRRSLPSVNALLESEAVRPLLARAPRSVVVDAIRRTIDQARSAAIGLPANEHSWADAIASVVDQSTRPSLRPVINGTGVIVHTNLGRAPLARVAIEAVTRVASGFSNLEYDVDQGARGSRYVHCATLLRELTGAEDALVVNNCAAALVLVLNTFANGRDALVSRGELIEIGGSFRIPEIMAKSGARLVEVGTTNRTHLDDYLKAIGDDTGIVAKVHRSNFAVAGFVAEASAAELGTLSANRRIPLLHDLGSGLLTTLDEFGLRGEPTAAEAVRAAGPLGLVTMSGDKLLGGPQAGVILGSRDAIERVKRNPLTRSYRVDKLTLAALEATLALYRDPARAMREIPVLAQVAANIDTLRARAQAIRRSVDSDMISVTDSDASVGGGAFPTARIPSIALAIGGDASAIEQRLRLGNQTVIPRIADGNVIIDLRTVFPSEDLNLVDAIRVALQ